MIYITQCFLVFGVPTLFGWVILRRIFREANVLVLCPCSIILGLAALMAVVNELRFFLAMGPALWFSYKLLLVASLLLVAIYPCRAGPPLLPASVKRTGPLTLLLLGVGFSAVYYGIPAFRGILGDAWWFHYPTAIQIQNVERFPLNHVFAPDTHLYYHYGPDILAASWAFLLDRPVQTAFALYILILAPCSFLLAFALLERIARNYWSALFGASFLIVGGNLRFLLFLSGKYFSGIGSMQVFNSQIVQGMIQLMFTPSHTLGLPLNLAAVLMFRKVCIGRSLLAASTLGLFLGTFTLVSEWYFLPLVCGLLLLGLGSVPRLATVRSKVETRTFVLAVLPSVIAIFWGSFNNSYVSGIFGHYWMSYQDIGEVSRARHVSKPLIASAASEELRSRPFDANGSKTSGSPKPTAAIAKQVAWTPPDLVPLSLNTSHFGKVPSWESADSNGSSFVPIISVQFFLEALPILLIGIPFSIWIARKARSRVVILLSWLAISSAVPPIFLDWGYRSTDFLRFFTASFSYSAIFCGWFAGILVVRKTFRSRALGTLIVICCMVNPVGLGVVGLIPGNIEKVKQLASTASSLSTLSVSAHSRTASAKTDLAKDVLSNSRDDKHNAFERLAVETGDYLFPVSHGRDRAIVVVSPRDLPPLAHFPEWMKMATLSRLSLPVGWHWNESLYSDYYRSAVLDLNPEALIALDAKWIIISNVFEDKIPTAVENALADKSKFAEVATFRDGDYYMSTFLVNR